MTFTGLALTNPGSISLKVFGSFMMPLFKYYLSSIGSTSSFPISQLLTSWRPALNIMMSIFAPVTFLFLLLVMLESIIQLWRLSGTSKALATISIFLPAYSPFLNPVEECFSKLKGLVKRKLGVKTKELIEHIGECSKEIVQENCHGWVDHGISFFSQMSSRRGKNNKSIIFSLDFLLFSEMTFTKKCCLMLNVYKKKKKHTY